MAYHRTAISGEGTPDFNQNQDILLQIEISAMFLPIAISTSELPFQAKILPKRKKVQYIYDLFSNQKLVKMADSYQEYE